MALWQVPAPPLPPELPIVVGGGMPEWVGAVVVVVVVVGAVLLYPLLRALARRLEGKGGVGRDELDQLHERMGELEALENRVLELENRVEFSERLLSRVRGDAEPPR